MARSSKDLPDDVETGQVWQAPDGQHFQVLDVFNGVATLNRCTPAGRVLNSRYQTHESVDRMQAEFKLVSR